MGTLHLSGTIGQKGENPQEGIACQMIEDLKLDAIADAFGRSPPAAMLHWVATRVSEGVGKSRVESLSLTRRVSF